MTQRDLERVHSFQSRRAKVRSSEIVRSIVARQRLKRKRFKKTLARALNQTGHLAIVDFLGNLIHCATSCTIIVPQLVIRNSRITPSLSHFTVIPIAKICREHFIRCFARSRMVCAISPSNHGTHWFGALKSKSSLEF